MKPISIKDIYLNEVTLKSSKEYMKTVDLNRKLLKALDKSLKDIYAGHLKLRTSLVSDKDYLSGGFDDILSKYNAILSSVDSAADKNKELISDLDAIYAALNTKTK